MKTLYMNGRIYTAEPGALFAEALVIDGERIAFVGDLGEARAVAGEDAAVEDLGGRMLMPGLHDAHTHLLASGMKWMHERRLPPFATPERIVEELTAAETDGRGPGPDGWVVGGEVFPPPEGGEKLTRKHLDAAFPDTPVYLYDYSIHHGVANSRALEIAGIHDSDVCGHGGAYLRDEAGALTGELIEEATWKVLRSIPDQDRDTYRSAVEWAMGVCHRFGITSVQEASASRQALQAYRDLEDAGALKLRVAAHLVWRNEGFGMGSGAELDALLAAPEQWESEHVDARFVKVWMDGAPLPPVPTHAPLTEDGRVDDSWLLVQEDELYALLLRSDAAGRSVKAHCAGDGAVRVFLDALARVRAERGAGVPHEIAHAGFVADEDYARIPELNATAEMSPALWHIPEYGLGSGFKFGKMLENGARMTIGSDWIITPDPNLFPGLQGVVQHASHPAELEQALAAVTRVGAEAVGKAHERGTLAAGKQADFIILDRDLFEVDIDEVGAAVVLETFVGGERVYAAAGD